MNLLLAIFTVIMSASALPFPQLPSIGHLQDAQSTTKGPKPFTILPSFPESGRKRVVLESESFLGQIDSKYGVAQQAVADVLNPKPIVDTIKEEDKYGNDGERFKKFGRMLVNGYEALSNALNAIVDVPVVQIKVFGRQITDNLNAIGGKLVGL